MPLNLCVAAAQIMIGADMAANTQLICDTIQACAERSADLCVFPEAALTGYSPAIGRARPPSDWEAVQHSLDRIGRAAAQHNLGVVLGSEAWDHGAWVNRLYAFGRQGETLAVYDKVHLTQEDRSYYRPGEAATVFDFEGVCCGMQICYDVRFPEGYRSLLAQGARLILQGFYGAGSGTWKVSVLGAHLRSRAAESGSFLVAANVAGPLQIVVSQIIDPLGLVLAAANQDHTEIIVADLDLARIDRSEIRADWFAHFQSASRQGVPD